MSRELMAVRLDAEPRARLLRLARRSGRTSSELVREAIAAFVARYEGEAQVVELTGDLLGCVDGPPGLATGLAEADRAARRFVPGGARAAAKRRAKPRAASRRRAKR